MWNTNDDRCSNFGHLYEKKSLKMWKHLFVVRALSVGQCGILMMIDAPILAICMRKKVLENVETSLCS